ncbi:type II secretion system F family protein [Ohessyouella blattaphilus]|uniref:type II secretion system F family protein n=1 Tax=Ohessyouella blattaphilus TaxID=2949333 RepID=UPI003EBD7D6F
MLSNLFNRNLYRIKNNKYRSLILFSVLILVLGIAIFIFDLARSKKEVEPVFKRGTAVEGAKKEALEVEIGDSTESLEVEIEAREYADTEVSKILERESAQLETYILGKNKSLDKVTSNLLLITKIPQEPFTVDWYPDRYDIINLYGEINTDNLAEEGTLVNLRAVISYQKRPQLQTQVEFAACIFPPFPSEKEKEVFQLEKIIKEKEEGSRTEENFALPREFKEEALTYYRPLTYRGITIMLFGLLIGILAFAKKHQDVADKQKQKERQMLLDYHEIIYKLTMLLSSGMVLLPAWKRIIEDAARLGKDQDERFAYQEMKQTYSEITSGKSEAKSFEDFGRRCKLKPYLRLSALLSQHLKQGSTGLAEQLKSEGREAFLERKLRAKRLGEEAGTKLLLPMFMMLAIALAVIVIPAFLSINI